MKYEYILKMNWFCQNPYVVTKIENGITKYLVIHKSGMKSKSKYVTFEWLVKNKDIVAGLCINGNTVSYADNFEMNDKKHLSKKDVDYLLNIGYLEEDMVYINRAMYLTDYTLYDDNSKPRKISAKKAKEILGQEGFLSGLARSTFHHDASRENVFFNSSRYHYCDGIVL